MILRNYKYEQTVSDQDELTGNQGFDFYQKNRRNYNASKACKHIMQVNEFYDLLSVCYQSF